MIKIVTTITEAKQIGKAIHEWRKANIVGYSADSWANCNDSDSEFDSLYKHQTDELWYVPIDNESGIGQDGAVESLPDGWSKVEPII
jgi:hypothetical protein